LIVDSIEHCVILSNESISKNPESSGSSCKSRKLTLVGSNLEDIFAGWNAQRYNGSSLSLEVDDDWRQVLQILAHSILCGESNGSSNRIDDCGWADEKGSSCIYDSQPRILSAISSFFHTIHGNSIELGCVI